jgi:AcrR family transcriptional regulator
MPREPLTRERVVQEALRIVDRDGLDALTMRRLGSALGVEAMSLYHHVPNKAALLDAVVEAIMREDLDGGTDPDTAFGTGPWTERLERIACGYRDLLLRHPHAVPIVATRPLTTPASLRIVEACLAALRTGGLAPAEALAALNATVLWTLGFVLAEVGPPPGAAPGATPEEALAALASLAPDEFPLLLEAVAGTTWGLPDGEFRFGLEVVVRGLEAVLGADG